MCIVCVQLCRLSAEELRQVSHAFININYFPKESVSVCSSSDSGCEVMCIILLLFQLSLEGMVRCGVSCLKPDYIPEYLSKVSQWYIAPYIYIYIYIYI